ncbi:MAG: tetratricopeptide repeat protein [Flavobacteriales bacterium]|nr:tetratricopeptide repeat protein [Flavobacteriales bacterium]
MRRFSLIGLLAVPIPASAQIDSLKALLRTDVHDTVRMEALRELGYAITSSYDDLDEGKRNYRACMALAEREDNAYWLAYCTYGLAINYDVSGELSKALELLDSAETMFRAIGDLEYVGNAMNARGTAYYFQGITDKAMVHFMRALDFAEKNELLLCGSQALNNIAIVHRKGGEHREALAIYRRSIAVKQQLNDRRGMANTLSNMGVAYDRLDRSDSALASFEQAIAIYRELQDDYEVGATRIAMAEVHVTRAQNAEAVTLLEEAIAMLKDSPEDQFNYAHAHLLLGRALTGVGRAEEALDHLALAEDLLAASERAEMLAELYRAKAEALYATGEHREAFEALKLSHAVQDSIQGEESKRSLEELRTRFDTHEKEKWIEVQGLQLEKQEQERRTFLAIMAVLVVLVGAAVILIIGRMRSNRKLQVQKRIVEQALGEKELLLREIHHRVKNNLQTVSSLLSIQGRGITDEKAKEAVNDSRLRVKSMALIHQDLYREGDITGVRMKEYVEKLVTGLVTSYAMGERVRTVIEVEDIALDVDTAVPIGLVLNELVTNALKYAWPDDRTGILKVRLAHTTDALALVVADDGMGNATAPSSHDASGFGLNMVRTFAAKLKAEWSMTNEKGTTVDMRIRNFKLAR